MGRKGVTAMPSLLSQPFLMRNGNTDRPMLGQHTGRTDVQLIEQGGKDTRKLAERLSAGLRHADGNKQLNLEASQPAK